MEVRTLVRSLVLTSISAAIVSAPVVVSTPASAAASAPFIVSVGDSFASGEGAIGSGWLNDGTPGNDCHRSPIGGHKQAADSFGAAFLFLACSGAVSGAVSGPNPLVGLLGSGGQLSKVAPSASTTVDALLMSIGGNDLDFASIVASCALPYECFLDPNVTGGLAANLSALPGKLSAVVSALQGTGKTVQGRVRHVFVTEYPDPTTGVFGLRCGLPLAEPFQLFDFISVAEAEWASTAVIAPLNAALANMVATANAQRGATDPVWHFVNDVDERFFSHGYCTGIDATEIPFNPLWWTRPRNANPRFIATMVDSYSSQWDYRGAMHPNDLGQGQIAAALKGAMDFLRQPQLVTVTPSSPPVAGVPVTLTVQVSDGGGQGLPNAPVWAGGNWLGWTNTTGSLTATTTFAAAGTAAVVADGSPYPAGSTTLFVNSAAYSVSSSPNPLPLGVVITNAVLDATDAYGQRVNGTFTLKHGGGTVTKSAGQVIPSIKITPLIRYEPGPNGKPIAVKECPTLTFKPSSAAFAPMDAAELLAC